MSDKSKEPKGEKAAPEEAAAASSTERISPATARQGDDAADGGAKVAASARRRVGVVVVAIAVAAIAVAGFAYAFGWLGQDAGSSQAHQPSAASPEASSTVSPSSTSGNGAGATAGSDGVSASGEDKQDVGSQTKTDSSAQEGAVSSAEATSAEEEAVASEQGESASAGPMREQSAGNSPSNASDGGSSARSTITVYLSIDSSRASEYGLSGPSISTSVELDEGATVYDALCASGFSLSGSSMYVSAIGGLAEKQCGSGSGWTYAVDGEFPGKACGRYVLSGGESIAWIYSTEKDPTMSM